MDAWPLANPTAESGELLAEEDDVDAAVDGPPSVGAAGVDRPHAAEGRRMAIVALAAQRISQACAIASESEMAVLQRREIEVSLQFQCGGCGFTAPTLVRGRGLASGPVSGEGLSRRAHDDALKNARMRCELTPCPRCGRRAYTELRRALVRTCVTLVAFIAVCAIVNYASDTRAFERNLGTVVAIYGSILALMLGGAGILFLLEIRSAPRKVRFIAA
jgi:hypothetical protein